MKKILSIILVIATTFSLAFGAPIRDAIVAKILAVKAIDLLNQAFITHILDTRTPDYAESTCDFQSAYCKCRQRVYEDLFIDNNSGVGESGPNFNRYYELRTIAVAQFKAELHKGNTLMAVYQNCRGALTNHLKVVDSSTFASSLHGLITDAITAFELVQKEEERKSLSLYLSHENVAVSDKKLAELEAMLAKNRSAEQIARRLEEGDDELAGPVMKLANPAMTKFALRRWNEGGTILCERYLAVLRFAERDVAKTLPAEVK